MDRSLAAPSPAKLTRHARFAFDLQNLPYDTLIKHLALTSLRSLEDLILEAIYAVRTHPMPPRVPVSLFNVPCALFAHMAILGGASCRA